MSNADELLAAWMLENFRRNTIYQCNHLFHCPEAKATIKNSGWECECLSEVTRDDEWHVWAFITCEHGESLVTGVNYPGYYHFDLPQIIKEMMALDKERFDCNYAD